MSLSRNILSMSNDELSPPLMGSWLNVANSSDMKKYGPGDREIIIEWEGGSCRGRCILFMDSG